MNQRRKNLQSSPYLDNTVFDLIATCFISVNLKLIIILDKLQNENT